MLSKDIRSISCITKTQRVSCCCMAAIQSGLTLSPMFSSTFNVLLLSALSSTYLQDRRCIDIILIVPKYIPEIEHFQFFKFSLTAGSNASYGIATGYFCRTNFGFTPLRAVVSCNDRYRLVLLHLVHANPLSRLWDIANRGGRNLSFTTFLFDDVNGVQNVILLYLTICNKYWNDLTWDDIHFSLTSLAISDALSSTFFRYYWIAIDDHPVPNFT